MLSLRLALKTLARDWKSGELMVLSLAIMVAVAALSAVSFFTDRISQAVKLQASEALAADLSLQSTGPLPRNYSQAAQAAGLDIANVVSMASVVFAGDGNALANVRAVSDRYPLRGRMKIADGLLLPARAADAIPAPGEAWASTRLLARLGADVGGTIEVGTARLKLAQVLTYRPDRGMRFIDIAPSLLINEADLDATGLIQPGSRVRYLMLFAGDRGQVRRFKAELQEMLGDGERLRDITDVGPQISSAMDRAQRFLNLSALVSVFLAAVAVAMAARRYVSRRLDTVALMKCLGALQGQILRISVIQLLLMSVIAGSLGVLFGYIAQAGLSFIMRDLIGSELPPPGWKPVFLGLATSVSVLTGFALPGFMQLGRTPPLRVLRHDMGPPPLRYSVSYGAAMASMLLVLWWVVGDAGLLIRIAIGSIIAMTILLGAGWLLVRMLGGIRGAAGVAWRYGLANISRRGRDSAIQVVAFGLSLMVLLLLTVVRNDLMDLWRNSLPADAANRFLINIQPDEVSGVDDFLASRGLGRLEFVPIVRARMTAINDVPLRDREFADRDGRRRASRDANLSWASTLAGDNQVVAGRWWGEVVPEHSEISVEQGYADDLQLELGDIISFNIAGETVSATVTSFRTVEWDSFKPNFFIIFSPGALEPYPATYISSFYAREGQDAEILDLVRRYPSITVIDIDAIMSQVRGVMDKAALAVQAVFLFTLFAGLMVLLAAVQATRDQRLYEAAILRTLGAKRRQILWGVATEFSVIGLLAGGLAASGASAAGWFLAESQFQLEYHFDPALWLTGLIAGMAIVGLTGTLATRSVLNHPPVHTLRQA
ncbi:MAG: FtsX-like permease family protein [Proteobacteria bacterium]|nr:FtsX-like permease family protein [Pseudomonadota bacterium]